MLLLDEGMRAAAKAHMFRVETMRAEQSYQYLYQVYELVTMVYKLKTVIIEADDLQGNPGIFFIFKFQPNMISQHITVVNVPHLSHSHAQQTY